MNRAQQIIDRVNTLVVTANRYFGITLPPIDVRFDLRGGSAGIASATGPLFSRKHAIRFNVDMMHNSAWDHVYNETVPHELSHIICFFMGTDTGHGRAWQNACHILGGSAKRCHTEEVVYARGRTFEYTTTTGHKVRISETRHNRVQQGRYSLSTKADGKINNTCMFAIVN